MDPLLTDIIDSWERLPRSSGPLLQETALFDLKRTYAPATYAEMAKDVASFANALGGAIIVGADEGPIEPDYSRPLSTDYATTLASGFDFAIRDFCRPSPSVHVRIIPSPRQTDRAILVVNVESSVEQPIAARHDSDANAWRFPLRVGRHTEWLLPEQLPLFMNSRTRRSKLLLTRALRDNPEMDILSSADGHYIQIAERFLLENVDHEGSGAIVAKFVDGNLRSQLVTIPLDDVEAVWRQANGRWIARLSGRFEVITFNDGRATGQAIYVPPGAFVVSPMRKVVEGISDTLRDLLRSVRYERNEEKSRLAAEAAIRDRAHRLWQARLAVGLCGSAEEDWFRAIEELRSEGIY